MSASLVGSEMCIRDRGWAASLGSSPPSPSSPGCCPHFRSAEGTQASRGCLLYTSDAADDM
eukprot:12216442-Alexandrium_andersonii.AAC.1